MKCERSSICPRLKPGQQTNHRFERSSFEIKLLPSRFSLLISVPIFFLSRFVIVQLLKKKKKKRMFPRRCLSSSTRVARKLLHVEKLLMIASKLHFFFFLLLRSKHIYLKTEKNVADDSVGSCSQSRLKGGSPESLLSVVTRVSVGFNYSKSHLSETWSVEK